MPVIVQSVGVVIGTILGAVIESRDSVAALVGGARQRLVLDELAGIGLRRARRRPVDLAVGVVLLLEMHYIVVSDPNGKVARPEHRPLVLEALKQLVGVLRKQSESVSETLVAAWLTGRQFSR